MVFPDSFEEKIEFNVIRMLLKQHCLSEKGQGLVDELRCSYDRDEVRVLLDQVEEFRDIISSGKSFPSQDYIDMNPELLRLELPGTFIEIEPLIDLKVSLATITACINFLKDPENDYPQLSKLGEYIYVNPGISRDIDRILDDRGNIRDTASDKLNEIRSSLKKKQKLIEKKIRQVLTETKNTGWAVDDAEVTLRQGRLVIPVQAANKRKISGFVHDESASGKTVFIEPAVTFELNNEIRELESAQKREIIRILTSFTDGLRPEIISLVEAYEFLGLMDFIRAKARFAITINGERPELMATPEISWNQAVHPVLFLNHKAKNKAVVPLDIDLSHKGRILIISGPNAGGKSVCLKTIGLLQYMVQCGLLVPAGKNSKTGIFKKFFIEIGDEQSIDNDLSTYSSHLINIKWLVENADDTTMFLIDEFGAGTDPLLGGAIAEAILEKLVPSQATGVVTTHYSNLKLLADNYGVIRNGAMLFDKEHMQPLFKLKIGQPGSSFTFEIAGEIGLPEEILKAAAGKTGKTHLDFEKQLQQLEVERDQLGKQQQEFEVADQFLAEMIEKYQGQVAALKESRKATMDKALAEAKQVIQDANRAVEKTIRDIKEAKADKEKTKKARQGLKDKEIKIIAEKEKVQPAKKEPAKEKYRLKKGDWVTLKGHETPGFISSIKGDLVMVCINDVNISTSVSSLQKAKKPGVQKTVRRHGQGNIAASITARAANFRLSIDVRGKRADEAIAVVKKYIDDAIILNMSELSVIHGKGDGILRAVIREYLSTVNEIKHFDDEHVERGGSGITRINL